MANPRVHEIASDLGIESKIVLEKLKEMGEFVKGPSSSVAPPVARRVKAALEEAGIKPAAAPAKPKPAAAAKPAPAPAPAPEEAAPVADAPLTVAERQAQAEAAQAAAKAAQATQPTAAEAPADASPSPSEARPSNIPRPGMPRPGNNPFSSNQGMGRPGPRPGNNPFSSNQGMARPGAGAGAGGPRPQAPRPGSPRPGNFQQRPGSPGYQQRPGGPGRPGGAGAGGGYRPGGAGGAGAGTGFGPNRPPAGGGGRGRGPGGGTAGAFGRGGGKSKARKSKRTKRAEFEMREAPSLGGITVPRGDGSQIIRLRRGASITDLADKIETMTNITVQPGSLVTALFHLGEMATATESLDEATFAILGEELGYRIQVVSPEDEDKELLEGFDIDLEQELEDETDEDLEIRPPVVTINDHLGKGRDGKPRRQ